VTVVIPTHNGARFVAKALDSALGQTYRRLAVVVVDDGSTDTTRDVLQPYRTRAHIITQSRAGVSAARNRGMAALSSTYYAFLDADDVWDACFLERMVAALENAPEAPFALSDVYRFDVVSGARLPHTNTDHYPAIRRYMQALSTGPATYLIPSDCTLDLLLGGYPVYPSSVVLHGSSVNKAGGWDPALARSEDLALWLRCASGAPLLYLDEPLVGLGRHDDNVSAEPMQMARTDIEVIQQRRDELSHARVEQSRFDRGLGQRLAGLGWQHLQHRDLRTARRYYLAAARRRPTRWHALMRLPLTVSWILEASATLRRWLAPFQRGAARSAHDEGNARAGLPGSRRL